MGDRDVGQTVAVELADRDSYHCVTGQPELLFCESSIPLPL
jgi:hypothetical protein